MSDAVFLIPILRSHLRLAEAALAETADHLEGQDLPRRHRSGVFACSLGCRHPLHYDGDPVALRPLEDLIEELRSQLEAVEKGIAGGAR